MKVYEGYPGGKVFVDGRPLNLRLDLREHSPTGFNWGYGGSGPAQLALAILADVAGDKVALNHYQEFKRDVIASLEPDKKFTLTEEEVKAWLARQPKEW